MSEDEKIKTGMYIKKQCKSNIDKLKFYDVKPNEFFDKILKFDEEGLLMYIELISKFQNLNEGFTVNETDIYCTNNKKTLEKLKLANDLNKNELIKVSNESMMEKFDKINDREELTVEERIKVLENRQDKMEEKFGEQINKVSRVATFLFSER